MNQIEKLERTLWMTVTFLFMALACMEGWPDVVPISKCVWRRCGLNEGKPINCQPEENGTSKELAKIIENTEGGSVMSDCSNDGKDLKKIRVWE